MSDSPEYVFRINGMLDVVKSHSGALAKACGDAQQTARDCADELAHVERILKALPGLLEQHCCAVRWEKPGPYSGHFERWGEEPHGCSPSCTAVYRHLQLLGILVSPRMAARAKA